LSSALANPGIKSKVKRVNKASFLIVAPPGTRRIPAVEGPLQQKSPRRNPPQLQSSHEVTPRNTSPV
jgi:hypothetical protein